MHSDALPILLHHASANSTSSCSMWPEILTYLITNTNILGYSDHRLSILAVYQANSAHAVGTTEVCVDALTRAHVPRTGPASPWYHIMQTAYQKAAALASRCAASSARPHHAGSSHLVKLLTNVIHGKHIPGLDQADQQHHILVLTASPASVLETTQVCQAGLPKRVRMAVVHARDPSGTLAVSAATSPNVALHWCFMTHALARFTLQTALSGFHSQLQLALHWTAQSTDRVTTSACSSPGQYAILGTLAPVLARYLAGFPAAWHATPSCWIRACQLDSGHVAGKPMQCTVPDEATTLCSVLRYMQATDCACLFLASARPLTAPEPQLRWPLLMLPPCTQAHQFIVAFVALECADTMAARGSLCAPGSSPSCIIALPASLPPGAPISLPVRACYDPNLVTLGMPGYLSHLAGTG